MFCLILSFQSPGLTVGKSEPYSGPIALVIAPDKYQLFIAEEGKKRISIFDIKKNKIARIIQLDRIPTGLTIADSSKYLFVTSGLENGFLQVLDCAKNEVINEISAGFAPLSPVLSSDEKYVYLCNRFKNSVLVINLKQKKIDKSIDVSREPIALDITPDGKWIVVAHHLPDVPATAEQVSAKISFIDTDKNILTKEIMLPNGSSGVREIAISPQGDYAYIAHILARFTLPTTQLERGWMNTNALSIIDLKNQSLFSTVLLDDVDFGAANPWAVKVSPNGNLIFVTHAGTHELSIINTDSLLRKVKRFQAIPGKKPENILGFFMGFRKRISLTGYGPRDLEVTNSKIFIAEYFSDSIEILDFNQKSLQSYQIFLNRKKGLSLERQGEMLFNDASMCFQNWQSCNSCHPDGRADGLNWDLLNDGISNPKNAKSLLFSHITPPVMCTGVRPNAETAVRAGMKYIQFIERTETDANVIDTFLKSMKPFSSPYLQDKKLITAAKRGKVLFFSEEVGCFTCHPAPKYTDQLLHDVGTHSPLDSTIDNQGNRVPQIEFDTPSLIEVWRTAPYLHDGRYRTVEEVISKGNQRNHRGRTSHLNKNQINDLVIFVLSL
jgi:DNA-binding beta-propeller fold protein YncE